MGAICHIRSNNRRVGRIGRVIINQCLPMDIAQEIEKWDGKSADDIGQVYEDYGHQPDFTDLLIESMQHTSLQKGSTWLLKKHLESGEQLSDKQVSRIFKLLPRLEHWETKLHILQIMPYVLIRPAYKCGVESFLRECLKDKNKFVRAWAYNGFNELASQYEEYLAEAKQLLETALREEAPSVKARIRNILKSKRYSSPRSRIS
ncbi:hypothetical protein [Rubellicoccus peritrichatus]|uniref:DNA alkylation repair enzyme n=1 Tax=Rubellicoccus peritrichatus TaxID=3080537 RepID=A0AAQ3LAN1_9BACT|nr:hypothetical protein [Puniceicoccus sp. CR14]WOO41064.1 hypothetical protein RZN69_20790 [Puniceicoccus sp. CR14]